MSNENTPPKPNIQPEPLEGNDMWKPQWKISHESNQSMWYRVANNHCRPWPWDKSGTLDWAMAYIILNLYPMQIFRKSKSPWIFTSSHWERLTQKVQVSPLSIAMWHRTRNLNVYLICKLCWNKFDKSICCSILITVILVSEFWKYQFS